MYKIEFSDLYREDLEEIFEFVGPCGKEKIIKSIKRILEILVLNPEMGKELEFGDREIIVPKYKYQIRYELVLKTISLLMIYKFKNR